MMKKQKTTGLDLWVGPSCDAPALMFRKEIKHKEGMGDMLPKLTVNATTMTQIIQTQATIHISMINAWVCLAAVFVFGIAKEVVLLSLGESHRIFALLQFR
jgi:hypothetical protein